MQGTTKCDIKDTGWQSMEWDQLAQNGDQLRDLLKVIMRLGVP
jgi:hypothetical protein